jgi:hypothetical protein
MPAEPSAYKILGSRGIIAPLRMLTMQPCMATAGAPGKCCYGSFLAFAGLINTLVWLLVITVALTIAATLVWLVSGLVLDSLVTNGTQ